MKQENIELLLALSKQKKQEAEQRTIKETQQAKLIAKQVNFAKTMYDDGVKPLIKSSQRYHIPPDHSPILPRRQAINEQEQSNNFYIGDGQWLDIPAYFSKNGQGKNDIRRLQTGHYPVVADVDLHGYTQEQAQQILNEFIEFTKKRGVCGEIVHGSGLGSKGYQPVLKNLVRRWLMLHPDVLAYAESHKNNDGAVRILLKRRYSNHGK